MKVVINKCYGGFGLSIKATTEYLKLKGKEPYFYNMAKRKVFNPTSDFVYILTKDYGDILTDYAHEDYFSEYDIPRNDPDLITVVESLGKESWGQCSELEIIEIPDDIEWEVNDYDGREWISEKHRVWS